MQAEASFLDEDVSPPTYAVLARVSPGYPPLPGRLPTCYSPVRRSPETEASFAHDLHVLSTPPAFILSQDQTLQFRSFVPPGPLQTRQALLFRNPLPAQRPVPGTTRRPPRKPAQARKQAADFNSLSLSSFQRTDAKIAASSRLRVPLVSEGRRSVGQAGAGVNPFFAAPSLRRSQGVPSVRPWPAFRRNAAAGNRRSLRCQSPPPHHPSHGYNPSRRGSIPPARRFVKPSCQPHHPTHPRREDNRRRGRPIPLRLH